MGPHPETAAGVRGWVKTQTRCANCPPQARGRARLGKGTNPVRVLPTAGARVTRLPAQTALRRDGACATCPPQARRWKEDGKWQENGIC